LLLLLLLYNYCSTTTHRLDWTVSDADRTIVSRRSGERTRKFPLWTSRSHTPLHRHTIELSAQRTVRRAVINDDHWWRRVVSSSVSIGLWRFVHRLLRYYADSTTAHDNNNTVVTFLKTVRCSLVVVVTTVAAHVHGTVVPFPSA